jgi:Terminase RNaseH-like domain
VRRFREKLIDAATKDLRDWFDEFLLYHRKDGKVHKEHDDLLSATRYALMSIRFAENLITPRPRATGPRITPGGWMAA